MKIAIIGDSGFVGRNLSEAFRDSGDEIVGMSKEGDSRPFEVDYKRYKIDNADMEAVCKALDIEDPEWIINLAAVTNPSRSYDYPYDFLKANMIGTFNVLEWIRHHKDTKMLHFSTDEVLNGSGGPKKELDRLNPANPYAASKAAAEEYIIAYNISYDLDIRIFRPFNIFGKYQRDIRVMSKIIINALNDTPFKLYKDPMNQKKGWIYVGNIYYAVKAIIEKGLPREIYNMKADANLSIDELKDKILSGLNKEHLFEGYMDTIRQKDKATCELDSSKIERIYVPKYDFGYGLEETIEWFRKIL